MKYKPASQLLRHTVMAALLAAGFGLTAQTLTNNLTLYAPFSGGSLNDVAGGLTGNPLNGPAVPTSGGVGGGGYLQLQNDGSSPKQAVWYSDPTPATADFSFQIWERAADITTAQNGQPNGDFALACTKDWDSGANVGWVLAKNSAAGNPNGLWWNLDATPSGTRVDFRPNYYTNVTLFDGVWHQWLVTFQRSGNALFYRDGVLVGSASISANAGKSIRPALGAWITNNILALGEDATLRYDHNTTGGGTAFNGDLDEAAMWGRLLTAEEVAAAYLKGTSGLDVRAPLAPIFVQQPAGGTRYTSDNFLLTCLPADDRGPVTYQWYKDGSILGGATTRSFLLTNLTNSTGNYTVVANDGIGSITSAPAHLTVLSAAQVTAGMAVYLNFDNNIDAQAGTTIGGTAIGNAATPQYIPGPIGSAAIFNNDGSSPVGWSSDWAVSLGDIEWIYTNNWSFSLWVNLTNDLDGGLLGNKDWTSGGNVGWVFAPYNSVEVNYYAAPGPRQDIGSVNVCDGNWHHVACVFNRDANTTYVYVDGNQTASASLGVTGWETLTPTTFSPNATLVGSSGDQAYSGAGAIDDLGIWPRNLTADEILAIYAQGLAGEPLTNAVAGTAVRPLITAQPQGATLFEGGKAALSVAATGSTPLSYQWYKNGSLLSGATTTSLLYYPASTNNTGSYTVVITNRYGSVTSSPPAVLTVSPITGINSGLAVYLNFDNNIDAQGGTTNGGTAVGNVGVPTYTNGIIGSAATFNNDDSDAANISDWAVSLGNIEWLYNNSFSFAIWVNTTDTYGGLLGNKDWYSGGNIGWVISEYRANWLNYATSAGRWDIGNYSWADGTWHHVAATFDRDANLVTAYVDGTATTNAPLGTTGMESLTPTDIMTTLVGSSGDGADSGFGAVDDLGMWERPLSSQEILAIFVQGYNHQPLTTASTSAIKPFILTPPVAETRTEGLATSFSVNAVGSAPLSYQWLRNGVNLPGATASVLSLPAAVRDSGASYTVIITNPYGSITSSPPATLSVTPAPPALTNGLVVYLNFDNNINAQAGTAVSGAAIGDVGVPTYAPGIVGQSAASFNNNDSDSADVSDWAVSLGNIEWIYTNNWTFSIWVETTDDYGALLGNKNWYSGANYGWCISEYYTDWLNYRAVGASRHDIGNFNWADGLWHNVAAVFYRDANMVYTYVDGALTAMAPLGNTGQELLTDTTINTTLIGSSGSMNESAYGAVDDLGMWVRPLSQAEVVGVYQAGLAHQGIPLASFGAPTLSAAPAGSNVTLSYPDWAYGYALQASTNLSHAAWTTVSPTASVIGTNTVVTVPAGPGAQFFRLQH